MWVTGFDDRFKWNVWEWGDPSRSRHSRHMCPKCPTIFKATFFFNIITLASQTVVFMPKKGQRFTKLKPNFFRLFINQFFLGSNYWAHRVLILRYRNSGGVLSRLHVSTFILIKDSFSTLLRLDILRKKGTKNSKWFPRKRDGRDALEGG